MKLRRAGGERPYAHNITGPEYVEITEMAVLRTELTSMSKAPVTY